jgi:hypothetical protein
LLLLMSHGRRWLLVLLFPTLALLLDVLLLGHTKPGHLRLNALAIREPRRADPTAAPFIRKTKLQADGWVAPA